MLNVVNAKIPNQPKNIHVDDIVSYDPLQGICMRNATMNGQNDDADDPDEDDDNYADREQNVHVQATMRQNRPAQQPMILSNLPDSNVSQLPVEQVEIIRPVKRLIDSEKIVPQERSHIKIEKPVQKNPRFVKKGDVDEDDLL